MNKDDLQLFPEAASTIAGRVDALFWFLTGMTVLLSGAIAIAIVVLGIRYRKAANVDRAPYSPSIWLELSWILVPIPILLLIFFWSSELFLEMQRAPKDSMEIKVVGRQWMWKLQHPSGQREIDELHVPTGRPIRLTMISEDVIHSFYVPAFRVKQDVLPGRYSTVWFQANQPGTYHLFCAEYCGTNHSKMVGKVIVQTPSDYQNWLGGKSNDRPPEVTGAELFERFRCGSCHGPQAPENRAPLLTGIFGKVAPLKDGGMAQVDDAYLRDSILRPSAKVVAGFQPIMPSYEGQITEEELNDLIAYIKTLGRTEEARP
jgi:cytochrome c oxidase subunit 2